MQTSSKKTGKTKNDSAPNIEEVPLSSVTIDADEVKNFNAYEGNWWDEKGPLKPLHELNPIRLSFIYDQIRRHKNIPTDQQFPYQGLSILDVGCGAGLISEPFARCGATVTGIDASETALTQARLHAVEQNLDIQYELSTIEKKAEQKCTFDVVVSLEVIEHVDNVPFFLKSCMDVMKPDGLFIISTLNRTVISYLKAIVAAEYILNWVPKGTHTWNKFLKPSEIAHILQKENCYFTNLKGIDYNIFKKEWSISTSLDTNYIGCAVKR